VKYKLQVTTIFEKAFRKYDNLIKQKIDLTIRQLEVDPYVGKTLRGNLVGKRSIRSGNYRVLYGINEDKKIVILYDTGHRKKTYGK
jgi:addiction module RelE/StbE family toxin